MSQFVSVPYGDLNSRQKENYNFHKVAACLADYGFNCLRLSDDWQGADFIACHIDGETFLKVQLKGRFCFDAKYYGKNIYIAFVYKGDCYVYPHDNLREEMKKEGLIEGSKSEAWITHGSRSWSYIPSKFKTLLAPYKLVSPPAEHSSDRAGTG